MYMEAIPSYILAFFLFFFSFFGEPCVQHIISGAANHSYPVVILFSLYIFHTDRRPSYLAGGRRGER